MPAERLRMRPWLENALNEAKFPGVEWLDKDRKIFKLPWKHASRNGWVLTKDASLFQAWAEHTGKYDKKKQPNPKTWKANFRCALNSLPDVEELVDRRSTKGNNAFKVYRIMCPTGVQNLKKSIAKKMKGRHQRKKRSVLRTKAEQKVVLCEKNDTGCKDVALASEDDAASFANVDEEYLCGIPQPLNDTHLVDHDYAVTRYFDLYDESGDQDICEAFDVPDSEIIKTEPLSPKEGEMQDDFSLYEESCADSKNSKSSCSRTEGKIMSDDEVIELIDEMSSDCGSTSGGVDAAMEELLEGCVNSFPNDFSSKRRTSSAPAMLESNCDSLTVFCPTPSERRRSESFSDTNTSLAASERSRNQSSSDYSAMLTMTPQDLLQSCMA